jgi:GntR family transcriptional repressor for pyruvate dehydrogenase complex
MNTLFDEIQPQSRSRQIVVKFRKAIEDGTLKQGDKLPPERDLCTQLGVSRTSLREAMRVLETYGLVESTQGGGTFITDNFSENVFDFLGFGKTLTKENFHHLLNTRRVLETGALEQALSLGDSNNASDLERLACELEKEEDPVCLGILDAQFHEKIVELSQNPILAALYKMIYKILLQGTSQVIQYPVSRDIAVRDHKKIARAFMSGDREACLAAIREHLHNTEKVIEEYLHEEE